MPDPRKRDPIFPDRPTHPDFERLSLAVQTTDMETEQQDFDFTAYTNSFIDIESLSYMAEQRAGTGIEVLGLSLDELPVPLKAFIVSTYMDGVMLGIQFQRAGGHRG